MKINRQKMATGKSKRNGLLAISQWLCFAGLIGVVATPTPLSAESPEKTAGGASVAPAIDTAVALRSNSPTDDLTADSRAVARNATESQSQSQAQHRRLRQEAAAVLIDRTVRLLASGPSFDAKLTQEIRAQGRSAVGVGRYEQAGGNTGRISMEMMIPTSNGKCLLQQMCDGRLAWTREQVGDTVRLRRVDVGRLDEMVGRQVRGISPRLRVGGLVELLERAHADYALEQVPAELEGRPVWMLRGTIRPTTEEAILRAAGREDWPPLCPRWIAIAIAADDDEEGFGAGLPVRFEYWSDEAVATRRLISYLKIYDLQKIQPAPETHFRFETGESDVNYVNDTQRYLDHFGIQVTDKQQRLLTR